MKLSRDEMLKVIEEGGSVMLSINGTHRHFTKQNLDEFPSVADLALGNKEAEQSAKAEIEARLAELLAEKAKLEASEVVAEDKPVAKAEKTKETKG